MSSLPAVQSPARELLPVAQDWSIMLQMADALYKSGLLPAHIKSTQAALAVIQKGLELGVPPMYALSNIVVVQGRPTANAELMLALIYRDHGDNAVQFSESTAQRCTIAYTRRNWAKRQSHSFTIEEARQANLVKAGPWTQYPAAMLRARCISAVARMAFPDSIGGMYSAEELGAPVEVIDGQVQISALPDPEPRQLHAAPTPAPEIIAEPFSPDTQAIYLKLERQQKEWQRLTDEKIPIPSDKSLDYLRRMSAKWQTKIEAETRKAAEEDAAAAFPDVPNASASIRQPVAAAVLAEDDLPYND